MKKIIGEDGKTYYVPGNMTYEEKVSLEEI